MDQQNAPSPGYSSDSGTIELDMMELVFHLLLNIKYIVAASLVFLAVAFVYTQYFVTPVYKSVAKLYMLSSTDSFVNLADLQLGSSLTSDYQEVFRTWEMSERVIEELKLPYSHGRLLGMMSVSNPSDTRVLYITVTSSDPLEAQTVANAYARVAQDYIAEVMSTERPNILSDAQLPKTPVSPNLPRNLITGFLAGLFLSVVVLVVIFLLDDRVRTADDIQRYTGLATLSVVPMLHATSAKPKYNYLPHVRETPRRQTKEGRS